MNANPSRQRPAEEDESAQLLSRTARDLPPGRHQFHKERLMAQIQDMRQREESTGTAASGMKPRRLRLPRPAITLPAVAAAVTGVIVAVTVLNNGGGGGLATGPALTTDLGTASSDGVPQLLDRISHAASAPDGTARPIPKPGQFVYVESRVADSFLKIEGDDASLASHALHTRKVWKSPDGTEGWLIDPAVNDSPEGETLSLPDEQGNTPEATINGPSYDYLTKLTTDPDQLLAKIYKETEGQGNSPDQQAFSTIGDLLGESYPPTELYSALFKTAAKIPGVVVVNDAEDAAGREGIAVARLDETSGAREEWIFDRKTFVFLGERSVQVNERTEQGVVIEPGTIMHTSAVIDRAVVDGMKQTPETSSPS